MESHGTTLGFYRNTDAVVTDWTTVAAPHADIATSGPTVFAQAVTLPYSVTNQPLASLTSPTFVDFDNNGGA